MLRWFCLISYAPKYGAGSPLFEHHTTSLVFNDPPLHTRVRTLIMGALTRRAIADMEPGLVMLVDSLLDQIEARGGGDLIEDFASAIPVEIIGNLLGVPHADRGPLRHWSLAILGALEPRLTPEQALERALNAFTHGFDHRATALLVVVHDDVVVARVDVDLEHAAPLDRHQRFGCPLER